MTAPLDDRLLEDWKRKADEASDSRRANAAFIAITREAVPAMYAEIQRLRDETRRWRERCLDSEVREGQRADEIANLIRDGERLRERVRELEGKREPDPPGIDRGIRGVP